MNPLSFELMQTVFTSQYVPQLFIGTQTDEDAFLYVNQLTKHTDNASFIRALVVCNFPADYKGNTISQLDNKIERAITQRVQSEDSTESSQTDTQAQMLISLALRDGAGLIHDKSGRTYIVPQENGKKALMPLDSWKMKSYLTHLYYTTTLKPPMANAVKQALDVLDAKARYEGKVERVFLRVGEDGEKIVINAGGDDGRVVEISREGYEIASCDINFLKTATMSTLPLPAKSNGQAWRKFKKMLQLSDENFARVLAFIINCLQPNGPYMCLIVLGEQGSGKSVLCRLIKLLVDPSPVDRMQMPKSIQDLMILAADNHLLMFDNLSGLRPELADALCTLSTGGGFSTRKLYTDSEQQVFEALRPFIANGITELTKRADLLERAVLVRLPSMPVAARMAEKELMQEFDTLMPELLDELYLMVAYALDNRDKVPVPQEFRMVDAVHWVVAAEGGTDIEPGTMLKVLGDSQQELMLESVMDDPLLQALLRLLKSEADKCFEGRVINLYEKLSENDRAMNLPKTPAHLSKALQRNSKSLMLAGLHVEFLKKDKFGRTVKISYSDQNLANGIEDGCPFPI